MCLLQKYLILCAPCFLEECNIEIMEFEGLSSSSDSNVDDVTSSYNEEFIDIEDNGVSSAAFVRGAEPDRFEPSAHNLADDVAGHAVGGDAEPNDRLGNTDWWVSSF